MYTKKIYKGDGEKLKLLSFKYQGKRLFGPKVKKEEAVWDMLAIATHYDNSDFPTTIIEGIASGLDFVESIHQLVIKVSEESNPERFKYAFSEIEWLAPIPRTPKNILCVGKNYLDHATEMGDDTTPEKMMIFTKSPTTIAADEQELPINAELTEELDYEGELAIVISKGGRNIPKQLAYDHVFGYTIANDITARDIQTDHGQFFLGKSLDGSCPMGPYLVTKDELPNADSLSLVTKVNDEVRQNGNTKSLIFKIDELITEISRFVTLETGDIILTGTPAGVGKGMNPPTYLRKGDTVKVSIEGIGTLSNRFV